MEDAVVDAVEDAEEDEEKDEAVAAAVPATSAPISNITTTFQIFKDGVRNAANADTQIVMNGVTAVASTSSTTAPTAATD